jgi:pimeloyl-ACP methyl ester carboxylesterase
MPYAENQGVRIYYEVEGQGPPLVLAHGMGFGASLEMWRVLGYSDALSSDFRLILYDLRGHGRSDKPHGESAGESDPADDVVAVLDTLGISKAHFFGYSMGGAAGFRQAVSHSGRFYSFILGGITPGRWPEAMVEAANISAELTKLRRTDPEAYLQQMERLLGHALTQQERDELLSRDSGRDAEASAPRHERQILTDQQLQGITAPCLLFCGDRDPFYAGAQESVQFIPRGVFISLGGLNHITAISRSDVIVRLVKQFLAIVGTP